MLFFYILVKLKLTKLQSQFRNGSCLRNDRTLLAGRFVDTCPFVVLHQTVATKLKVVVKGCTITVSL